MAESLANTNVEALTGIVPPWNTCSKPKHLISILQEQCVKLTFWLVVEMGAVFIPCNWSIFRVLASKQSVGFLFWPKLVSGQCKFPQLSYLKVFLTALSTNRYQLAIKVQQRIFRCNYLVYFCFSSYKNLQIWKLMKIHGQEWHYLQFSNFCVFTSPTVFFNKIEANLKFIC